MRSPNATVAAKSAIDAPVNETLSLADVRAQCKLTLRPVKGNRRGPKPRRGFIFEQRTPQLRHRPVTLADYSSHPGLQGTRMFVMGFFGVCLASRPGGGRP